MMKNNKIQIFLIVVILILTTLSCNETVIETHTDDNLLANGSFEENNIPSLDGWRFGNKQLADLVNEAAPNGGSWALQLTSDWAPTTGFVYTPVTYVKTGDIVRLSAYVRGSGRFGGRGIIKLVEGPSIYSGNSKSISSNYNVWTEISIIDTLALSPNDTLWVILSSPITEIVPFQQLFDVVKLEKIGVK